MEVAAIVAVTGLFTIGFAAYLFAPLTGPPNAEPTKFHLADVFSLVVLWQYPLALITFLRRQNPLDGHSGHYVFGAILLAVITALWLGLAKTLSRRGVHSSVRRFIVIALATPLAIAATLVLFPTATGAIVTALKPRRDWNAWLAGVAIGCLATGLLCRLATVWALRTDSLAVVEELPQETD